MVKLADMIGIKFGSWTVVELSETTSHRRKWNCVCDCGRKKSVFEASLRYGKSKSCGSCGSKRHSQLTRKPRHRKDRCGEVFGKWTVMERAPNNAHGQTVWKCVCECGKEKSVLAVSLTMGKSTGCRTCAMKGKNVIDLTGVRFGKLVAVRQDGYRKGRVTWECKCDCGNFLITTADCLGTRTRSCGCLRLLPPGEAAFNRTLQSYKGRRGRVFGLTDDQAKKLFEMDCHYCGASKSNTCTTDTSTYEYNGIDRVDSSLGYTEDNCVPCCRTCNLAKNDMPVEEFLAWAYRLVAHQSTGESKKT